jgi:hypothetical protein
VYEVVYFIDFNDPFNHFLHKNEFNNETESIQMWSASDFSTFNAFENGIEFAETYNVNI